MACEEGTRLNAASRYTRYTKRILNGQLTGFIRLDTGETILFPFRISCYVFSNFIVTVGMLTPGLGVSRET